MLGVDIRHITVGKHISTTFVFLCAGVYFSQIFSMYPSTASKCSSIMDPWIRHYRYFFINIPFSKLLGRGRALKTPHVLTGTGVSSLVISLSGYISSENHF